MVEPAESGIRLAAEPLGQQGPLAPLARAVLLLRRSLGTAAAAPAVRVEQAVLEPAAAAGH